MPKRSVGRVGVTEVVDPREIAQHVEAELLLEHLQHVDDLFGRHDDAVIVAKLFATQRIAELLLERHEVIGCHL